MNIGVSEQKEQGLAELLRARLGKEIWDYTERRSRIRVDCQILVDLLFDSGPTRAEIRDISIGGAKVYSAQALKEGDEIELCGAKLYEQTELQSVRCVVRWSRELADDEGWLAGVEFSASQAELSRSWLLTELNEQNVQLMLEQQRRRMVRVRCSVPARLLSKEQKLEARIVNLSPQGALVQTSGSLMSEGEKVGLIFGPVDSLSRIVVRAKIANVHSGASRAYGIKFLGFDSGSPDELKQYLDHFSRLKR